MNQTAVSASATRCAKTSGGQRSHFASHLPLSPVYAIKGLFISKYSDPNVVAEPDSDWLHFTCGRGLTCCPARSPRRCIRGGFRVAICLNLPGSPLDFSRVGISLHPSQQDRVLGEYLAQQRMLRTKRRLGSRYCPPVITDSDGSPEVAVIIARLASPLIRLPAYAPGSVS